MTLTVDQFADFAQSSIAGGAGGVGTSFNTADTTLLLQTGAGALFPSIGPFRVLIGSAIVGGTHEITTCTSRATDTLTLTRGQEGTGARQWGVNTTVQQVVTAGNLQNIWNQLALGVYPAAGNEMVMPAGIAVGQVGAWSLVANTTISTIAAGLIRVTSTTNVTGVIMQAGSWSGQMLSLANEGPYTITFAASSSRVADGSTSAIASNTGRSFFWDSGTSLWYRQA